MRAKFGRIAAAASVALTGLSGASASAQTMPPGSYLRRPAQSGAELASQIAKDPVVARRYARVFNLPADTVKTAMGKLRATKLREDRVLRVFYVHKGERLGYKVRRVPKGTAIFATADGTPALVKSCGNPLHPDMAMRPSMAMVSPSWIRKYHPNEPVEIKGASAVGALIPWPQTDAEGRVVSETSPIAGDATTVATAETPTVFLPDAPRNVPVPRGSEYAYFTDWYRTSGTYVPSASHTVATSGYTTNGYYSLPNRPYSIYSSVGLASTPEPGPMALLGAAGVAGFGMLFRRRRAARS